MKLLYQDAQGTDGSDPSKMVNVYLIAGRKIRVRADIPREQVKAKIAEKYGLSTDAVDRLEQIEDRVAGFDLDSIDSLGGAATVASLIPAIKLLAKSVIELRGILQFQMKEDPPLFPVE